MDLCLQAGQTKQAGHKNTGNRANIVAINITCMVC